MADKSITNSVESRTPERREDTRSTERYLRPAVDIVETEAGLIITADLPGVEKEGLEIGIDKGILTIQGKAQSAARGNDIYREFELMSYYRQFQLPEVIDQEKTGAEYANGVLTLRLFKAEAAKPRRIEVQVG
jgi:HSP20 family molecular chaperone IbpA